MIERAKIIHIVGADGIGISALARLLGSRGAHISSSDVSTTGHRAENVPYDTELLIYSNAVPEDNPERARAAKLKIPQLSYPQALGEFARGKKVIAVAGTNGKTTTTAMIAWIMTAADWDPTVVVGSKVLEWNTNARLGKGEWLVLEADEYRRAFLNYPSDIAVITNIAEDHLDYYRDLQDIKSSFGEFVAKIRTAGHLVINVQDENCDFLRTQFPGQVTGFVPSGNFRLKVPGEFNQANASAAAAVCRILGISQKIIDESLASFPGTWRRFEHVAKLGQTEIISDYAHHPDGLSATLKTAAELYGKVLAVFQPHQRNRTKKLFTQFVKAFCSSSVENFIISEIFDVAGRDEDDLDITSKDLVREIQKCGKKVKYAKDLEDCEMKVRKHAANYSAIIIMGAGDINKVVDRLVNRKL